MIILSKFRRNQLISFKFNRNTLESERNLLFFDKKRSNSNEFHLNSSEIHSNSTVFHSASVVFSLNQLYFIVFLLYFRILQSKITAFFVPNFHHRRTFCAKRSQKHTTFFFFCFMTCRKWLHINGFDPIFQEHKKHIFLLFSLIFPCFSC